MIESAISPLTGKPNLISVGAVESKEIISIYRKHFDMDVSRYFAGIEEVTILQCLDTGYQFYYPFSTEGDEEYYAQMSQFDWYYNPGRWEHDKALELIGECKKVLEVGAGAGFFIERLSDRGVAAIGLELNGLAIDKARGRGLNIRKETIQAHAEAHEREYDVVCSFQVLEHITHPLSFLEAKVQCLKPGGKLIVGVPNNDSYYKDNKMYNKVLNMPPHHVGLWTLESLSALQPLLDVKLESVNYEPLVDGNVAVYLWNKLNNLFLGIPLFTRAIWKLKIDRLLTPALKLFENRIKGNSMLVVFTRN